MAADFPRSVDEIYDDYIKRRSGILRALTDDVEDFFQACDPTKDNLCLYGLRDGNWSVDLPADEVPPELPEPCLGINFARDGMQRRDWLSLVAVHSDAWLLSVAFFYGVKLDATARARLFKLINQQSTLFETLGSKARPSKPQAGGAQPQQQQGWQAQQQPNLAKKKKLEVPPHDVPPARAGVTGFNAGSQNRPTESAHPSGKPLHIDDITPALKGRHAELFWPDNKLWYLVEIQQINVKTKSAKITYASGEEEDLDLDEILREGHMCLF